MDRIALAQGYELWCLGQKKNKTLTGLAIYLDFESVKDMFIYAMGVGDEPVAIRKAILLVENFYENCLFDKATTAGAQFALARFGWREVQKQIESDLSSSKKNFTTMTDEELLRELNLVEKMNL